MDKWWAGLDRARRMMIVAIGVMTVSQFMNYIAPHTETRAVLMMGVYVPNASSGAIGVEQPVAGTSGWTAHPYAWLILGALGLLFATGLDLGQWWTRWRYWIAVAGLVLCLFPFDLEDAPGWGLLAGVVAIAIGVWAARASHKSAVPA
jgi:hypothetical protein